jgi:predicted phage terminase large subunit-like protein
MGSAIDVKELEARFRADPELLKLWTPRLTSYMLDTPTVKQYAMLLYNGFEGMYGGGVGSGKTVYLLNASFQYADVPGYKALLLRRTYQMCIKPDGLIPRLVNHLKRLNLEKCWTETKRQAFLPHGSIIEIGYAEEEKDIHSFDGNEYQFIGIDQVEMFTPYQYKHLLTRLRRPKKLMAVPLRMRCTANPSGPFKNWYKQWFIRSQPPVDKDGVPQRIFIPATARDNPHLDLESYENQFKLVDALPRKRLWDGDWDAEAEGMMFNRAWFERVSSTPVIIGKVAGWDRAGSEAPDADWTVGALWGMGEDGKAYLLEIVRGRWTSARVDDVQRQKARDWGIDTMHWGQQDPGAAGKSEDERIKRDVFRGFNYDSETTATNQRGAKANRWRPLAVAAEHGEVRVLDREWTETYLDEMESLSEDGSHDFDDQGDASSTGFRHLVQPTDESVTSLLMDAESSESALERFLGL